LTPPDTKQALAMLDAFASVGATAFDVSLFDIEEVQKGFQSGRSVAELQRSMSARLEAASRTQNNIVIRPRSTTATLIQLDDFSDDRADKISPFAFMIVQTSPNNNQVWLAVSDGPKDPQGDDGTEEGRKAAAAAKEAAKQFRKRVRKGAGADKQATGATRLAGSLNIKPKYAPDFPVVALRQVEPGKTVTVAGLEAAGLIAPPEAVTPPASVPEARRMTRNGPPPKSWPDYQRTLQGAPMNKDGSGPDRSLADFMFCKWAAERGWMEREIAAKLAQVSSKAQERIRAGDVEKDSDTQKGYCLVTAENAVRTVERERTRRQTLKPAPNSPR
jgi:hypothetical protein